jgi:hypothetical protein
MKLDHPLFGYPDKLGADEQKKARIALEFMHKELKFIDGEFINEFVHHRFGGTAQQTAKFIDLLKDAGAWQVRVSFKDFGEQDSALMLYQVMPRNTVDVIINSGRKDFGLKDFQDHLPKFGEQSGAKKTEK